MSTVKALNEKSKTQTKLDALQTTLEELQVQRQNLAKSMLESQGQTYTSDADMEMKALESAKHITQRHIRLLSEYNEIKDVATSLIGMIAENRQQRIVEVMRSFGAEDND